MSGSELERVAMLAARFAALAVGRGVRTGIGDDAAVLEAPPAPLVWTIDAQVEGTHFRREWLGWNDVGWRSFMAAASDLAAMGAAPLAALSALSLSDDVDDAALDDLARGQAEAAAAIGAAVVGGNLARGKETSVTTTLLGTATHPISRSGARPGDHLLLAGSVGKAGAGLAALERAVEIDPANLELADCLRAWRRPRALVEQGMTLAGAATAAIDVSDGLARDSHHVAVASNVVLVFDEIALREHTRGSLDAVAAMLGRDALEFALRGGEDYALLVCSPVAIDGFVRIGTVEAGAPAVMLQGADGQRRGIDPSGFDHFAGS